jgi:hypothetical protein
MNAITVLALVAACVLQTCDCTNNHDRIEKLQDLLKYKREQAEFGSPSKFAHIMRKLKKQAKWASKQNEVKARKKWLVSPPTPAPESRCGRPVSSCCGSNYNVKQPQDCERCLSQVAKRTCLDQMVPLLADKHIGKCFMNITVPALCAKISKESS